MSNDTNDRSGDIDKLFERLARSTFRSSFKLGAKESTILAKKGVEIIAHHARDIVTDRLAPADPKNDGRQTPMRNHPVFIAQHATATCCRKCLAKWHHIPTGMALTPEQIDYIVVVIVRWLTLPDNQ